MIAIDEKIELLKSLAELEPEDSVILDEVIATLESIKAAEAGLPVEPAMDRHMRQDVLAYIETLRTYAANWQEEARRYCGNSDYWRGRAEKAEAENAALREFIKTLGNGYDDEDINAAIDQARRP